MQPNLSLKLPYIHILNCFGMQPIFVNEQGKIDESFVGFVYRVGTTFNKVGRMHQMHKYRINEENECILKNAFHIKNAENEVVRLFLNERTFTFKQNASLDELLKDENHQKLKDILQMHFERIKYYTMMCVGNFIITSRKELYNKHLFIGNEIRNYTCYLVSETILPRNVLILGHTNDNVFRTPYVACPIIEKNKFNTLCKLNGIDLNKFDREIDSNAKYPLSDKYLNLYSLYQSYLDNVEVPYWYIETFNTPSKTRQKAYYTTLFFD